MRRRRLIVRSFRSTLLSVLLMLGGAVVAWAFFTAIGSGAGAAPVGALSASSIGSATAGAGTVALAWSSVSSPTGSGTLKYFVTRDGGNPGGTCPAPSAPAAVTSCTDTGLAPGSHTYIVTALWRSWTSRSGSRSVTVSFGALDHLVLAAATTSPVAGATDALTISAKDSSGNTVATYTGDKTLTFGGASTFGSNHPTVTDKSGTPVALGTPETITFTNGVASTAGSANGAMTLYKAETAGITVTDGTVGNGTGLSVTVSPASAAKLVFTTAGLSGSAASAASLGPATVKEQDQYGNPTTTAETVSLSSNSSGTAVFALTQNGSSVGSVGIPGGSSTASFYYGDTKAGSPTVTAHSAGLTDATQQETITGATLDHLTVTNPGAQTAGIAFNQTITAVDQFGNPAGGWTSASACVTFSGPSNSPSGQTPAYPATAGCGTGNSSLSFNSSGQATAPITLYDSQTTSLTVTSVTGPAGKVATTAPFTVSAGTLNVFTVPTPSSQTAGSGFNETVTAIDAWGNVPSAWTSVTACVTFSGPSNSPSGQAPAYPGGGGCGTGNSSLTFSSSGQAIASINLFDAQTTNLTVTSVTAPSGKNGTSGSFTVSGTSLNSFNVPTPSSQTAGNAFNETITAVDQYGNAAGPWTSVTACVTFAGPSNSPSGQAPTYPAAGSCGAGNSSLSFSSSGKATASIALFDAQTTSLTVTSVTAPANKTGSSSSFTVGAGSPTKLAWTQVSTTSSATPSPNPCSTSCTYSGFGNNKTWSASLVVTDGWANTVTNLGSGHSVTVTLTSSSGATLNPSSPATLTISATGAAVTGQITYTSGGGGGAWTDTLTAASSGYASATASFSK
jgi:hypothetical protein